MTGKSTSAELEKQVDEQKKYIDNLVHQLEKFRHLAVAVQDLNDAITVQDFDGNITIWNKGAQKMYGWSEAQALEMNISEIVPPEKADEVLGFIRDISQGNERTSFETKRITADGRILDVWLTATALVNEEGVPTAIVTTERDITEQKHSIKEKAELIKELQKINLQLQKAISETKTLRGIIPICMICKQIRNDKGFWEQVEVYVHNHTEADFSHGICPNCLQEKFPKVYKKKLLSAPTPRKMLES
jgi:PAS domain S-box-containing protein